MDVNSQELFVELRELISGLGVNGGLVSASVYETAQVLRLYPPAVGVKEGLNWLIAQQLEDGGWGTPTAPLTRDVPTLATILTLHTYRHEIDAQAIIQAGMAFLHDHASQWERVQINQLGVACELIVPHLIEEAAQVGLYIDPSPYATLFELRGLKLAQLSEERITPNSAPCFSWEALDLPHVSELFQPQTGVGHSPAATAAWLKSAKAVGENPELCMQAEAYLQRASTITGEGINGRGIAGVMPTAYPITGMELCYGLYPLVLTGLILHPALQDVIAPKLAWLRAMLDHNNGLGFGDGFVADADDTSVAVIVLQAADVPTDVAYVRRFWQKDHFFTYTHELNPSVYSNAHALHALVRSGERCKSTEQYLIEQQVPGGGWNVDKWHTSWRSSTMEVIAALLPLGYQAQLRVAGRALLADQNDDGSWGSSDGAHFLETTHCVIALRFLLSNEEFAQEFEAALGRGEQWLLAHRGDRHLVNAFWLCKEAFSPIRVDNLYQLGLLVAIESQFSPHISELPEVDVVTEVAHVVGKE